MFVVIAVVLLSCLLALCIFLYIDNKKNPYVEKDQPVKSEEPDQEKEDPVC